MNIGIFTNAYKPIISGVVNSIDLFSQGLRKLGAKVHIFAPQFPGYKDIEQDVFRFHSINLSTKVKYPLAIPISHRIWKILPELKLDVIHTHHPFILGDMGAYIAKKNHLPLIFTFHTQYEQYSHYIPLNQKLVKTLTRLSVINFVQKCDLILTPAQSIQELLNDYGITKPVIHFPNAINTADFAKLNKQEARKLCSLSGNEIILIYTGRIGLEKNLAFMVQAFKKIHDIVKNARLLLVGDGPEEGALRHLVNTLNLKDKVIFTGRVDYHDIAKYYTAADIFVMTSVTEVKPLSILEAMAAGLPVVAVSAPGSKDTITNGLNGILTKQNIEDYSGELLKLVQNEDLRRQMGTAALST